jgi:RHS repeat-associated protein
MSDLLLKTRLESCYKSSRDWSLARAEKYQFLLQFYSLNSASYNTMYTSVTGNAPPAFPTCITDLLPGGYDVLISAWFIPNMGCGNFAGIWGSFSDGDFDAVLAGMGSSSLGSFLESNCSISDHVSILKSFDMSRLSAFTATTQSASWWGNWYINTQSMFDAYLYTLNYYTSSVSGAQEAISGYLTKEDYLELIKAYFGVGTYDTLQDNMPQGKYFMESFKLDELYLYGSSRLGNLEANLMLKYQHFNATYNGLTGTYTHKQQVKDSVLYNNQLHYKVMTRGKKRYELSNHLGNVLAVVSDQWEATCSSSVITHYNAVVIQATDYSAFGAPLPGRTYSLSVDKYRYGFNGKESDQESQTQDYGMRVYDPRLGKFLSVDPLTSRFPWWTPYQFAGDMPIEATDLDGAEPKSSKEDANQKISDFKNSAAQSSWAGDKLSKDEFVTSLTNIIENPECINQTEFTNFCGRVAPAVALGLKDNPAGAAQFLIDLYTNGSANYDNCSEVVNITLDPNLKTEMNLKITYNGDPTQPNKDYRKGTMEPAAALLGYALSSKYNLGIQSYSSCYGDNCNFGTENDKWAATLMGTEQKMIEGFWGYKSEKFGGTFRNIFSGTVSYSKNAALLRKADAAVAQGNIVIMFVNSSHLLDFETKEHNTFSAHWVIYKGNQSCKSIVSWWDYGSNKTGDRGRMINGMTGGFIIKPATGN